MVSGAELSASSDIPEADSSAPDTIADNTPPVVNREAEQQLWQDVERVIENTITGTASAPSTLETDTASTETAVSTETDVTVAAASPPEPSTPTTEFTEPIPWGAPVNTTPRETSSSDKEFSESSSMRDSPQTPMPEPINEASQEKFVVTPTAANTIPALDAMQTQQQSPSPLVHPLRPPQRKRKSLSAVELPSFPPLPKVPTE